MNGSSSSLSGSRSSLFERVGSFKQAAKKKMKSLKRSLSLDRLGYVAIAIFLLITFLVISNVIG